MIYKDNKNIQLSFNLKKEKIYEKYDFLVSKSNKQAYKLINKWPDWESRKIIIFGDSGTGKTHLSKIWQEKTSAIILNLNKFKKIKFDNFFLKKKKFIIENISNFFDKINKNEKEHLEKHLLHFYNLIEEKKANPGRGKASKAIKELGKDPKDETIIKLMDGRYGPYVKSGKINASVPKDMNLNQVTLEIAIDLIENQKMKKKKK